MNLMDIKINNRLIIILVILGAAVLSLAVFAGPLWGRIRLISNELAIIEEQSAIARKDVESALKLQFQGRLLSRAEISMAMDEITKTGRAFDINFLSISPREIEDIEGSVCQRMPVALETESEYKDFGLFLGALADLKESVVTIRNFDMQRDEAILPRVQAKMVIDIYLKGGHE